MGQNIWAYRQGAFNRGNGWHEAIDLPRENNLQHLIRRLDNLELRGQVSKLALVFHGDLPGIVQTNPIMNESSIFENAEVCGPISSLRDYLQPSAQIMLVACSSAAGPIGSRFLCRLSTFWPGRTVIGFITSGEFDPRYHTAGDIFDTGGSFVGGTVLQNLSRQEHIERRMMPSSRSAKWAKDGNITRLPIAETMFNQERAQRTRGGSRQPRQRDTISE